MNGSETTEGPVLMRYWKNRRSLWRGTKDDVTPSGKYFVILEEETVDRLTKYIYMQDNYMEKRKVCVKHSYCMTFMIIYIFLILYFTYLHHRVLSGSCLLSELFIELHSGLDWTELNHLH